MANECAFHRDSAPYLFHDSGGTRLVRNPSPLAGWLTGLRAQKQMWGAMQRYTTREFAHTYCGNFTRASGTISMIHLGGGAQTWLDTSELSIFSPW